MQSLLSKLQVSLFTFALLINFFILSSLNAHEIRPAVIEVHIDEQGSFLIDVKLNLEAKIARIGNTVKNSQEAENVELYDTLREMTAEDLAQEFLLFEDKFLKNTQLSIDNKPQVLQINSIDIPDVGDLDLARDSIVHITANIPNGSKSFTWKWDKSLGNAILRVSTNSNPELYTAYLIEGKSSDAISLDSIIQNETATTSWGSFVNYIQVGFVHIIPKGLDHILFVVGLFLLSATLKPLLIQITTFTLAHSITLALGIYGIVSVPSSIVEPLIAASIIYVAIENIFSDNLSKWRPVVVFLFGLLHGLGFASVLKEIGLSSSNYVPSLIGFNVGVELGQLTVITACFILVGIWFKDKPWYRQRITIPASILIAIIAAFWLFERTVLA